MQHFKRIVTVGVRTINQVSNRQGPQDWVIMLLRNDIRRAEFSHANGSTIKNNKTAVNCLERFLTERGIAPSLTVAQLTPYLIKSFEQWHIEKGYKLSYSAQNMRCLRAMLKRIAGREIKLFSEVRTSNCQTEKRALSEETMRRVADMQLSEHSFTAFARDLFMACFYGMGIPLVDLLHIRKSQCTNQRITYYRRKTHRKVEIEICPEMQTIIDRYADDSSPFLFPVLTATDSSESMRQYRCFYQKFSRSLGHVARQVGEKALTSYQARHSWASIAYKNHVSINDIAQALGHSNTKITQAYIKDIDISHLSKANNIVKTAVFRATSYPFTA